uniref:Uridylate kinase-like n=1 Tax=Dermatophagoides pteronyssinus TaxID=6956 RepID=A0A6P6Y8S1_DERPT|nr:uridylate kinase-like [Dermatophagoides pteronyssinus]
MNIPQILFVLGGPGCGKGTWCKRIAENYSVFHLSAGDCLREEQKRENSEYKELIESYIVKGAIVPSYITNALVMRKIRSLGLQNVYLLDGFPRNMENYESFMKEYKSEGERALCIYLNCSEETMLQRLNKRSLTSNRIDDNLETIKLRFKVFADNTLPVVEKFRAKGRLIEIDTNKDITEQWDAMKPELDALFEKLNQRQSKRRGCLFCF